MFSAGVKRSTRGSRSFLLAVSPSRRSAAIFAKPRGSVQLHPEPFGRGACSKIGRDVQRSRALLRTLHEGWTAPSRIWRLACPRTKLILRPPPPSSPVHIYRTLSAVRSRLGAGLSRLIAVQVREYHLGDPESPVAAKPCAKPCSAISMVISPSDRLRRRYRTANRLRTMTAALEDFSAMTASNCLAVSAVSCRPRTRSQAPVEKSLRDWRKAQPARRGNKAGAIAAGESCIFI